MRECLYIPQEIMWFKLTPSERYSQQGMVPVHAPCIWRTLLEISRFASYRLSYRIKTWQKKWIGCRKHRKTYIFLLQMLRKHDYFQRAQNNDSTGGAWQLDLGYPQKLPALWSIWLIVLRKWRDIYWMINHLGRRVASCDTRLLIFYFVSLYRPLSK